jgi:hypothetical protein
MSFALFAPSGDHKALTVPHAARIDVVDVID